LKAKSADKWVIMRMSATDAPNYYLTNNFVNFLSVSNIQPQSKYNWLTTELVKWKTPDGTIASGVLYKPEDFDSKKKYPVILTYYEKWSNMVYDFLEPGATRDRLNIPYFVSRGYIVFAPDISYKIGNPGESAFSSIISASSYLSKFKWINENSLGLYGHSFGGYETIYTITHTNRFAAAAAAAGISDLISFYGGVVSGGISAGYWTETYQGRIGATLWERPDLYIKNSPIFEANRVNTPLLMMNNKNDSQVHFEQGLEFFMALRRLNKRAWLLQYDEGTHSLNLPSDANDFTIRLTQFFDHYLKGVSAPVWMTKGIPARAKGIEMGYEIDRDNKKP
jgi:dipeptidyl aminopeptidase/acylaminoacyl peptidase